MSDAGPRGDGLAEALRARGIELQVEARGNLAVLTVTGAGYAPLTTDARREVLAIARAHGFTHAALEVPARAEGTCDSSLP